MSPGFKTTEIGVLPFEWDVAKIGELATTSSGTTPARANTERYFRNGRIPWVKTLDLNNSVIWSTEEYVTEAALAETSLQLYPAGSVLVAMYGGYNQIGRTGLLQIPATVNQALTAIRPDRRKLNPGYLLRVLNYRVDYWKSVASSSRKDPNITGKDIAEFRLAVPPMKEQEAIAQALSDADAFIESLEQLLTKKRHLNLGAMQELLTGRRRLPTFALKTGYKQTEVGLIPDEWAVSCVRELVRNGPKNGYSGPNGDDTSGTPTLSLAATSSGRLVLNDSTIKALRHRIPAGSPLFLEPGDVLVQRSNTVDLVGTTAIFDGPRATFVYPDLMMRLRFTRPSTGEWFWRYANSTSGRAYFRTVAAGSTGSMPKISGEALRNMPVPVPPPPEQEAVATVLCDMDTEIAALETRLAKARQIRQGMMQELLTGRTRLV